MNNLENSLNPERGKEIIDFCPNVISFQTDYGSVYEKISDGTFRRHKYDGTEYEPMEWTMFTDRDGDKELQMIKVKLSMSKMTKKHLLFMFI